MKEDDLQMKEKDDLEVNQMIEDDLDQTKE